MAKQPMSAKQQNQTKYSIVTVITYLIVSMAMDRIVPGLNFFMHFGIAFVISLPIALAFCHFVLKISIQETFAEK